MNRGSILIMMAALVPASSTVSIAAGDAAAGKDKAIACATCHGVDGKREIPLLQGGMSKLAGMDEQKLLDALKAYRYGRRLHPMMQFFVLPYSDKDLNDIAAYYSSLKDPLFTPQK
ncbi:MAG TPA: c-type cytochrome [Thiobacillaceae bacterium]|nr:c-type cytochrome [Thiobacillaceae bacterium]